jgi:hypothetical protein
MNRTDLINAAEDLNELLGLDPAIDTSMKVADLKEAVKDGGMLLQTQDSPKPATIEVLKELPWGDELDDDVRDAFLHFGILGSNAEEEPEEVPEETEPEEAEEVEAVVEEEPEEVPEEKPKKSRKPGVIATIVSLIEEAGEEGITKDAILEALVAKFPERASIPMKNTINVQVPGRITKERFPVEKLDDGRYRKAN